MKVSEGCLRVSEIFVSDTSVIFGGLKLSKNIKEHFDLKPDGD